MRIACAGGGGHAKVVADAALSLSRLEIVGFLDDNPLLVGRSSLGLPVLGPISAWRDFHIDALIPAIGANRARRKIMDREVARGAVAMTIVHPKATVSAWAGLKDGVVVLAGAVINANATIGRNVIINTGAIVEHDCDIGDHAHVAPGCYVAGEVRVGEGSFLGLGSRILPGIKIGDWCVIGAGAVVTADVEDHAIVVGVPARRLR
jgi:sugar O-acyltransferase (sialic acid O-acetyltransferase NeuD family)